MLGALRAHIQELQVRTPQAGALSTNLAVGTTAIEEVFRARKTNTRVLPEGALVTTNVANRPMVCTLKGIGINMVAFPRETLYVL